MSTSKTQFYFTAGAALWHNQTSRPSLCFRVTITGSPPLETYFFGLLLLQLHDARLTSNLRTLCYCLHDNNLQLLCCGDGALGPNFNKQTLPYFIGHLSTLSRPWFLVDKVTHAAPSEVRGSCWSTYNISLGVSSVSTHFEHHNRTLSGSQHGSIQLKKKLR